MDDSFADRMRNRALQRLQKNAHLSRNNDLNKENISKKADVDTVKPVIAEHLTIKKSLSHDKMDCDDKETKNTNNTCDFVLSERNCNEKKREEFFVRHRRNETPEPSSSEEKRDDVYVKHCKNRLANLAGKFKQFEEEDSHVTLRPNVPKQTPVKRRSPQKETSSNIAPKAGKYEPAAFKNKQNKSNISARKPEKPPIQQSHIPAKKEKLDTEQNAIRALNTPEKKALDQSVVKTLESQGYKRTESDAHLIFDFKKARSVFVKDTESGPSKNGNSTDPSLLSVAERRKLFEKRLRGEDVPTTFGYTSSPVTREQENRTPVKNDHHDQRSKSPFNSHYEVSDHSEESNDSVKSDSSDHSNKKVEPKEDVVLNISEETCSSFPDLSNDQDANISVYPVLQTVKQIKFVSTPKPGHLYPSMSDVDCDADESSDDNDDKRRRDNSKLENSFSINENDNSFGRDVLFATNSIFSSFQNSRREEMSEVHDKTNTNILTEVKQLISADNDTSLSLSPVARSSLNSVECPNETASFTYMKTYPDASIHLSPISPHSKNSSKNIPEKFDFDEQMDDEKEEAFKKNELDVGTKIKLLEEQIIKEKIMLTQAVRALKLCLTTSFLNSLSHLEAEKVVLLSQLKIVAAQNEIDRIKVENSVLPRSSASNSARGNVVLSNIKLPVRMTVVHADLKDDVYNNLLCVVKCGDIVLSTGVVPVTQTNIKQDPECTYVEFGDSITVSNVDSDFKITVEVYNLVVERKDPSNSKQHHSAKKDKKSHHGSKKEKESRIFPRHNDDKRHSQSSFFMVGYMIFSLNEVRRHQWILNKQDLHHTPLVGMVLMNLKCNLALTTIQKHGFLTMYKVISGYGDWSRYWFHLSGEKLSFWKYPEEETVKDPIGSFDLKKCSSTSVDVVGIEITMRPHTVRLEFSPSSYLREFKGLTDEGLLLSADNSEERVSWCHCLNEVLKSVRLWSNAVDQ